MKRITLIILAVVAIIASSVSCQKVNDIDNNPLSAVALSIIPDFSDGSVYSCSDEGSFFLRVSVKPEKYIEKLSDNDAFICKADFRSVITKANAENPDFTVVGEITSSFVKEGYMTTYFELAEDEVAKLQASDYVVSFSIEDKDNTHVASTSYVPMGNPRGGQGGEEITLIQPDKPLPGVFTVADPDGVPGSGDEKKVQFSMGNLASNVIQHSLTGEWGVFANQYDCMDTPIYNGGYNDYVSLYKYGDSSPMGPAGPDGIEFPLNFDFGSIAFPGKGWRMLSAQEWCYLFGRVDCKDFQTDESNPRSNLFKTGVNVMGRKCAVLYPDNYQGTKDETFITEKDYSEATKAGIVFLPLAGCYRISYGSVYGFDTSGYYWSNTEDHEYFVFQIIIGDSGFVNVTDTYYHMYLSVRLVKDYISEN